MSDPVDNIPSRDPWPPAPEKALVEQKTEIEKREKVPGEPIEYCPSCGRKLLTMRSVLCNWCGARIDDEDYLARAARERAAQDAAERERADQEIAETARFGVLGRLKRVAKSGKKPTDDTQLIP